MGAPLKVYTDVPEELPPEPAPTVTEREQGVVPGRKIEVPLFVGVPVAFSCMNCRPKTVKVPEPEKLKPLMVPVLIVYVPSWVTFTVRTARFVEVIATPFV